MKAIVSLSIASLALLVSCTHIPELALLLTRGPLAQMPEQNDLGTLVFRRGLRSFAASAMQGGKPGPPKKPSGPPPPAKASPSAGRLPDLNKPRWPAHGPLAKDEKGGPQRMQVPPAPKAKSKSKDQSDEFGAPEGAWPDKQDKSKGKPKEGKSPHKDSQKLSMRPYWKSPETKEDFFTYLNRPGVGPQSKSHGPIEGPLPPPKPAQKGKEGKSEGHKDSLGADGATKEEMMRYNMRSYLTPPGVRPFDEGMWNQQINGKGSGHSARPNA